MDELELNELLRNIELEPLHVQDNNEPECEPESVLFGDCEPECDLDEVIDIELPTDSPL